MGLHIGFHPQVLTNSSTRITLSIKACVIGIYNMGFTCQGFHTQALTNSSTWIIPVIQANVAGDYMAGLHPRALTCNGSTWIIL